MTSEAISPNSWHRLGQEAEFGPGSLRGALVGGRKLCVGRSEAGLFAVSDTCPHAGGSLSEGMVDGRELICPLHAWAFDVESGRSPDDPDCVVPVYPVRVLDGTVEVLLKAAQLKEGRA